MIAFVAIAAVTLASAAVAMLLRNLIHSALLLVASWAGIAAFYLWAGAEFVAFAQVLVYVGAISMVVLFAVLLTRPPEPMPVAPPNTLGRALVALLTGGAVLGVFIGAIVSSPLPTAATPAPAVSVKQLGLELAGRHAGALLIIGALLTVALLGAIVLAATDRETVGASLDDARGRPQGAPLQKAEDAP
ncbi:MAG: NADH-quinone oxidoreductase subunit J [Opitutaceae bacterium]|nr:NADH-quinone oxidoreductase subunit J [Opitutaceae bacterium]